MKYTLILSALLPISFMVQAQTQVIKCVDENGGVTYHNQKINTKGMKCNNTNLATIDKLKNQPTLNQTIKTSTSRASSSTNTNSVSTPDQEYRDLKRREILMSERNQEKKQLDLVKDMLLKANKNDETQMKQLNNMLQSHQNNINSLEKELKIEPTNFSNLVSTAIPGLGIPKNKQSEHKPDFQIEGATIINPPKDISTKEIIENPKKKEASSLKIPDLDSMRGQLNVLKRQRENAPEETTDKSQHIEIKRRQPGVNVSKASLDYQPLPTPLSVPDLGIGR